MKSAREIVEDYLRALYGGELEAARACLADDLTHVGPTMRFDSADDWMKAAAHAPNTTEALDIQKIVGEGEDVLVFYEILTRHRAGRIPIAEWHRVREGRIVSIRFIMDTAPFMPRAAASSSETAIDPVCKMTVEKATAAATRSHGGATYYFCNPGCAAAFEREPATYLSSGAR